MTQDEARRRAGELGLERLGDQHLQQFMRAQDTMARHLRRVPRDLPATREPALIFRAKDPAP